MNRKALGAVIAQSAQAAISLAIQVLVARLLGIAEYGRFAILYGMVILASGVVSGLVGDSLVVLQRERRDVRAGLQLSLVMSAVPLGGLATSVAALTGFSPLREAVFFGILLVAFVTQEIVRRLLMAHMAFARIVVADCVGILVALPIILLRHSSDALALEGFLSAIALGQIAGAVVGWYLLPQSERFLVGFRKPNIAAVWKYGAWRGAQQLLRPGLFTSVRLLVLAGAGTTIVGLLEAARTYTSPLILLIGGMSSFLFVRFANQHRAGAPSAIHDADRIVKLLVLLTALLSVIALALRSIVSPIAFGVQIDPVAVVAWLTYGMSVAIVTPYGALSAVSGRQTAVFAIRLSDTLGGLLATAVMVSFEVPVEWIPFALAASSLAGGAGLRRLASRNPRLGIPPQDGVSE